MAGRERVGLAPQRPQGALAGLGGPLLGDVRLEQTLPRRLVVIRSDATDDVGGKRVPQVLLTAQVDDVLLFLSSIFLEPSMT